MANNVAIEVVEDVCIVGRERHDVGGGEEGGRKREREEKGAVSWKCQVNLYQGPRRNVRPGQTQTGLRF